MSCSTPFHARRTAAAWLLACALAARPAAGLETATTIPRYVHDAWGTEDGLPQGTVQEILETRDGYLWFGTEAGLARFDGVRFTVFDQRTAPEMGTVQVRSLAERRQGGLLVGTLGGLFLIDGGAVRAVPRADGSAFGAVEALAESGDGTLWAATQGQGVIAWNEAGERVFTEAQGLPSDWVWSLLPEADGSVWAGTPFGLARLAAGKVESFAGRPGWPAGPVPVLRPARDGSFWTGGRGGIYRCRSGGCERVVAPEELPDPRLQAVWEDRDGGLWFGSRHGLHRWQGGAVETFTAADGLSQTTVRALAEDREGSLWVGTDGGGVDRFHDPRVLALGVREGLLGKSAYSVAESPEGVAEGREGGVWIGTESGLNRVTAAGIETWGVPEGVPPGAVAPVWASRTGAVWFGTNDGLARMTDGKIEIFTTDHGLPSPVVNALYEDAQGVLWVGTPGGLARFTGERFRAYTEAEGMSCNMVMAIGGARRGAQRGAQGGAQGGAQRSATGGGLWLGMFGGGVQRMEGERFTAWGKAEGLPTENVYSMLEDAEGTVWAGTDQGLSRLAGGRWLHLTEREGLFSTPVLQVLDDGRGALWLGSYHGPYRVAKRDFEELAAGRRRAVQALALDRVDGMESAECSASSQPGALAARDGRLWFATQRGVAVIDPARLEPRLELPAVVLEELLADGLPVAKADGLRFAPGLSRLEIQYTVPTFLAPDRVRFRVRLAGFDRDWIEAGGRRSATYTNLPPGRYRFEALAANSDGAWTPRPTGLDIYIAPRLYQRAWFLPLAVLLAGGLAFAAYRHRVGELRARFDAVVGERNRIAREIHDTLAQGLAAVSLQLEGAAGELDDSPPSARSHLERARMLVRQALAAARRSVWNLRAAELEDKSLPEAFAELAAGLSSAGGPRIVVKSTGRQRPLPDEVEDHLFRIGQEALANAVRHARAAHVEVELSYGEKLVRLRVADDGTGFPQGNGAIEAQESPGAPPHFGLAVMHERAAALAGHLDLTSGPTGGTAVTVEVPLGT